MTEDESRSANALFVEKKGILQKIAEANREILQDQLFIKNWILMITGTLSQQTLTTPVSIAYQKEKEILIKVSVLWSKILHLKKQLSQ